MRKVGIEDAARDKLLNDPAFAPDISPERRSQLLDDPDLLYEAIHNEASTVLTMGWDGGFPGTAGSSALNEWHGIYFLTSSDFDDEGSYSSLEEALAHEWFAYPTPGVELFSNVLPMERLKEIGLGLVETDEYIRINDQYFTRTSEGLELMSDDEVAQLSVR